MVQDLKAKADNYDTDYKLQVWVEIDALIDMNISDFLEVASPKELKTLLTDIKNGAAGIQESNPDIQKLTVQLQKSISETILRVETAAN